MCRLSAEVHSTNSTYRRSGFDCVVKRLGMALYKSDCDFND